MDKQYYKEYYELERSHWWFQGRLEIIESLIKKHIKKGKTGKIRILNIGVATGATTIMLEKFGDVTSVEYDEDCCVFLKEKVGINAINASLTNLPFKDNSYDLVCAFDVIEHIEDDLTALCEIKRVLSQDGFYFLTVPAFNFLWNHHDEVNHHYRRYTMSGLVQKTKQAKLSVTFKSYFNFWLFFPIAIFRVANNIIPRKVKENSSGSDFEIMNKSKVINKMLFNLLKLENRLLNSGIKFPLGVSISILGK